MNRNLADLCLPRGRLVAKWLPRLEERRRELAVTAFDYDRRQGATMRETEPSFTARRVAGYRRDLDRLAAPFGDPKADARLAADVAGELAFTPSDRMARHICARTAFFDRIVVDAIGDGVTQLASIAAGYDGRALRYAAPHARWFEIDHPATQADKRRRLQRLGVPAAAITFVPLDVTAGGLPEALLRSGWDPGVASAIICEGLAVYLTEPALRGLLGDLRAVASTGTRLAISLSTGASGPDAIARRERFRAAVAELGEPALNQLTPIDAEPLLAGAGWCTAQLSERPPEAGFVLAVAS